MSETKQASTIHLSEETRDKLRLLALKEKRRGKTDLKNFIEHLLEEYAEKNSETK